MKSLCEKTDALSRSMDFCAISSPLSYLSSNDNSPWEKRHLLSEEAASLPFAFFLFFQGRWSNLGKSGIFAVQDEKPERLTFPRLDWAGALVVRPDSVTNFNSGMFQEGLSFNPQSLHPPADTASDG